MSSNTSKSASTEWTYKPSSAPNRIFPSTPDDEIVISGVAGRYPGCDNVDELRENLYNKVSSIRGFSSLIEVIWTYNYNLMLSNSVINEIFQLNF